MASFIIFRNLGSIRSSFLAPSYEAKEEVLRSDLRRRHSPTPTFRPWRALYSSKSLFFILFIVVCVCFWFDLASIEHGNADFFFKVVLIRVVQSIFYMFMCMFVNSYAFWFITKFGTKVGFGVHICDLWFWVRLLVERMGNVGMTNIVLSLPSYQKRITCICLDI